MSVLINCFTVFYILFLAIVSSKKNGLHTLIDRFHTEKSNLNTVFCSLFRMNTNN